MRSKNINKQKDPNNEAEYEESSVTDEVPRYFNIFWCDVVYTKIPPSISLSGT